ncbi:MAG: hypothetical protein KC503_26475 [Myxococcales bacterium]|nr:hypothetical protein [Myxococcales bacterium]
MMLRNAPHRSCLLAGVLLFAAGVAWAQPTSQPQSQPASQPTSRPAAAKARIVFTGDTGGLASNRSRGPAFSALLRALRDREGHAHIERTGWAALRRRGRVIVGAGLRSSTLAAALGPLLAGKLERVAAPRVVQVLESESELVVQQPPHPRFDLLRLIRDEVKRRPRVYDPTLRRSTRRLTIYKLRSGERVYDLVEPRVAEASPPPRAAQWELWWSLQLVARIGAKKAPLLAVLK